MIAYLSGKILEKGKGFAIVLAGELGYKVQLAESVLKSLEKGAPVKFYTHQVIREDAQELFGFATMKELEFFWRLISVTGVGPKMALHLLALGPIEDIGRAIDRGDVDYLSSASGVGKKTAQRLVLDLRGKLVSESGSGEGSDLASALENLGYPRAKAHEAARSVGLEGTMEERLRAALKLMSRR
jgi:Holliday junction DNA helicase RuvA